MADAAAAVVPPPVQETPKPVAEPKKDPVAPAQAVASTPKEPVAPKAEPEKPNTLLSDPADPAKPKAVEEKPKADYSTLKDLQGAPLKPEAIEAVKTVAEKYSLSPETAQAVLTDREAGVKAYHESLLTGHKDTVAGWRKTVEAHPVLGGANLKATDEVVSAVVNRFGPKGLMETIQQGGYNWHPGFLEFLHNVAQATADDKFVQGGGKAPKGKVRYGDVTALYE